MRRRLDTAHSCWPATLALLCLLGAAGAANAATIDLVLRSGDPAPGYPGQTLFSSSARLNSSGEVLLAGSTSSGVRGLWLIDSGRQVHLVAAEGDPFPDGSGTPIVSLRPGRLLPDGTVHWWASTTSGHAGYFARDPGGTVSPLLLSGDPLPGGGTLLFLGERVRSNDSGDVLFDARFPAPGVGSRRVLVGPGLSGAPEVLGVDRAQAPAGSLPGDQFILPFDHSLYAINANGRSAFVSGVRRDVGTQDERFIRAIFGPVPDAAIGVIASQEGAAPGTEGAVFSTESGLDDFNDRDQSLVYGYLEQGVAGVTAQNDEGKWLSDGRGGLTLLVREGDPIPGSAGDRFAESPRFTFGNFALGPNGEIAGAANASGPRGARRVWLFATDGDPLSIILEAGDPIPGVGGTVSVLEDAGVNLVINGAGDLLLPLVVDPGDGSTVEALFVRRADGAIEPLLQTGQSIEWRPGDIRQLASYQLSAGQGFGTIFNDHGALVAQLFFEDGSSAVALISAPEPTGLHLLALGCVALLIERKRSGPARRGVIGPRSAP